MEYKVFIWDGYMETSMEHEMNSAAKDGWRVLTVLSRYSGLYTIICEREAQSE